MQVLRVDAGEEVDISPKNITINISGLSTGIHLVSIDDQIKILRELTGIKEFRAICNGTILNEHLSFRFYGFQDNENIRLISNIPLNRKEIESRSIKGDQQKFFEVQAYFRRKWANDKKNLPNSPLYREALRLRDLSAMRYETKSPTYRKLNYVYAQKAASLKEPYETVIPVKPQTPSKDLLPYSPSQE